MPMFSNASVSSDYAPPPSLKIKGLRPRLVHEFGNGWVLSFAVQDADPSGYVTVTLEK